MISCYKIFKYIKLFYTTMNNLMMLKMPWIATKNLSGAQHLYISLCSSVRPCIRYDS